MRDETLLRDYVRDRSEAAFAKLMERYLPMVYAVCLRETGERTLAEDATQAVFLVLARKAGELRSSRALPSWLYQTARLAARKTRQSNSRQREREQQAVPDEYPARNAPDSLHLMLDEAIDSLSARERDAVLLRYFTGLSVLETAKSLGISEGAAQMRIMRALDKLHRYLARRDAAMTGVGLTALLVAMADREASAALLTHSSEIAAAAQSDSLTLGRSIHQLAEGIIRTMTIAKWKFAATCGAVLILTGGAVSAFTWHSRPIAMTGGPVTKPVAAETPAVSDLIVLDPGRGGDDSGLIALDNMREKKLNLAIAKLAADDLQRAGFQVRLTRTGDTTISTADRVKMAEDLHAAMLVSIHCEEPRHYDGPYGMTVYYHEGIAYDRDLAQQLKWRIGSETSRPSNDIRAVMPQAETGFPILKSPRVISAFVNCGNMRNKHDLRYLENPVNQAKIASGIRNAVDISMKLRSQHYSMNAQAFGRQTPPQQQTAMAGQEAGGH